MRPDPSLTKLDVFTLSVADRPRHIGHGRISALNMHCEFLNAARKAACGVCNTLEF